MSKAFQLPTDLQPAYLRVLSEIATLLLRDSSPDEVAREVFAYLAPLLNLDAYFHYLITPDGTEMELQSCAGATPETLPLLQRLKLGQAVCGTVAQRCEFMYVPDVQQRSDEMTEFIRGVGIQCYLCQPLIANGELLGTFSFGTKTRSSYNEDEQQLLYLVAQQVAIAASRRKQSERLRDMEKLAATGRMAASLSHEINNPLESISNVLYLLKKENLTDHARELVTLATEELARVTELTQQALGINRTGEAAVPVPIRAAIEDVARALHSYAQRRAVQLDIQDLDGLCVVAHTGEFRQIITSLLRNAIEVSGNNGTVRISAGLTPGGRLELSVTDSGPGLPPGANTQFFQPFYRSKDDFGVGLGLWLTQQLVHRNNGDIRLASSTTPPTGTSVSITLPAATLANSVAK